VHEENDRPYGRRMVMGRWSPPFHERLRGSKMLILQDDVPFEHNSLIALRDALLYRSNTVFTKANPSMLRTLFFILHSTEPSRRV
jgi:hypothetical protein